MLTLECIKTQPQESSTVISMRCHTCKQRGTFESMKVQDLYLETDEVLGNLRIIYILGQRRCPNPKCRAHVFIIYEKNALKQLVATYPAERIDFDSTDIPESILASLEEAITCHANQCFVAAAIMVRKTMEELCRERGATGANLKERIQQLGKKVVLPQELLNSLDDLRLLGNDAAHIESQNYDKVGKEEVEVGIEVTKEVLKAVYQYTSLMKRLKGLKKNPTP